MRALLGETGQEDAVRFEPRLRLPVWARGRTTLLKSAPLPGALHLLPSVLRYGHLPWRDRVKAVVVSARLGRLSPGTLAVGESWADVLGRMGTSRVARERLWSVFAVAVENAAPNEIPAADALRDLRMALLQGAGAARMGRFVRPLGEVAERVREAAEKAGAGMRPGLHVRRLIAGGVGRSSPCRAEQEDGERQAETQGRVGVELQDGSRRMADDVILAVPLWALRPLLPIAWLEHPRLRLLAGVVPSPIVNVHLGYDRPMLSEPVVAIAEPPFPMLFRREVEAGFLGVEGGRHGARGRAEALGAIREWVMVSVSAAQEFAGTPDADLVRRMDRLTRTVASGPWGRNGNGQAVLQTAKVVWQHRATALPSSLGERPRPDEPLAQGVWLCGDWTGTGWPQTLEGAVRSGEAVSQAVLHQDLDP